MKKIIAMNTDGLGVRLCALRNAIYLANYFGIDFNFTWKDSSGNKFHDILPVDSTFSNSFIERHFIEKDVHVFPLTDINDKEGCFRSTLSIDSFVKNKLNFFEVAFGPDYYFDRIEFSEELDLAKNLAKSVSVKANSIALHLRAGDVVYGTMRQSGFYCKKYIPYPTAISIINGCVKKGIDLIVFSHDKSITSFIREQFPDIVFSQDFIPVDYTRAQEAIFDIFLMSRCRKIVAPHSGFSIAASIAGNVNIVGTSYLVDDFSRLLNGLEILKDEKSMQLSSYQVSSACLSFLTEYFYELSFDQVTFLADMGSKSTPDNFVFTFLKYIHLLHFGKIDEADDFILSKIRQINDFKAFDKFLIFNVSNRSLFGHLVNEGYVSILEKSASSNFSFVYVFLMYLDFNSSYSVRTNGSMVEKIFHSIDYFKNRDLSDFFDYLLVKYSEGVA